MGALMRIQSLEILNFRAIREFSVSELPHVVIVAGPNGCGKSCVLDAIRGLKSAYGSYHQADEWQAWLNEFHVQESPEGIQPLLQDKSRPMTVSAVLKLTDKEREFLRGNCRDLLLDRTWREVFPDVAPGQRKLGVRASALRARERQAEKIALDALPDVLSAIESPAIEGVLEVRPDGSIHVQPSALLELIFSTYMPQELGVIDYNGANRQYGRENVGGVQLSAALDSTVRLSQHALYNYSGKYNNIKAELASAFVQRVLAAFKGKEDPAARVSKLDESLRDLFATFFPDKEFLGPDIGPAGKIAFPVRTRSGAIHDLDDLSSGEKEILFGYLRLREAAPRRSVLLLDEPELHLNPRMTNGLARFYHRHLGLALENQLWLITHSDSLIREVVGDRDFAVYHMVSVQGATDGNQASLVAANDEVSRVLIDLVGDLSTYQPMGKLVILEGGDDGSMDKWMIDTLFPNVREQITLVAAGSKQRVQGLYDVLEKVSNAKLAPRVYSICDSDWDIVDGALPVRPRAYKWNVYHIENYLIDSAIIFRACCSVQGPRTGFRSEAEVEAALQECVADLIPKYVRHQLLKEEFAALHAAVLLRTNDTEKDVAKDLVRALKSAGEKVSQMISTSGLERRLSNREAELRAEAEQWTESDEWKARFPGRKLLARFVERHVRGIAAKQFQNLIVGQMQEMQVRPSGMAEVIERILAE